MLELKTQIRMFYIFLREYMFPSSNKLNRDFATVEGLEQGYVVCDSDMRFLLLHTFLKKNAKKKVIVFLSSCLSVKFHAELLNYIDVPVMDLYVNQLPDLFHSPFQYYVSIRFD